MPQCNTATYYINKVQGLQKEYKEMITAKCSHDGKRCPASPKDDQSATGSQLLWVILELTGIFSVEFLVQRYLHTWTHSSRIVRPILRVLVKHARRRAV